MLVGESVKARPEMSGDLRTIGVVGVPRAESASEDSSFDDIFRTSIEDGMTRILGVDGAKATLFHLDFPTIDSSKKFHDKLTAIFRAGAPSLERVILQHLHEALGVRPASPKDDFVSQVERARHGFGPKRSMTAI
jgi:hypothetical protein